MTQQLPTKDQVRLAMDQVLKAAENYGRRPTISAVERQPGISHPTF